MWLQHKLVPIYLKLRPFIKNCELKNCTNHEQMQSMRRWQKSINVNVFYAAMQFLIKMIHGSEAGLKKLIRLFRKRWTLKTKKDDSQVSEENWESHCTVSKRQVEKKITSIANKESRPSMPKPRWYVHPNVFAFYKLENIAVNDLVSANANEKSPSHSKAKSSMIASFTNVKDTSEKRVEERTQEIAQTSTDENTEVTSMDTTPPVRLE